VLRSGFRNKRIRIVQETGTPDRARIHNKALRRVRDALPVTVPAQYQGCIYRSQFLSKALGCGRHQSVADCILEETVSIRERGAVNSQHIVAENDGRRQRSEQRTPAGAELITRELHTPGWIVATRFTEPPIVVTTH
jgi:hypothetical protein